MRACDGLAASDRATWATCEVRPTRAPTILRWPHPTWTRETHSNNATIGGARNGHLHTYVTRGGAGPPKRDVSGKMTAVTGRGGVGCKSIRIEGRRRRRCCVGYAPARGGEEEREEKRMGRVAVVWSASPSPSSSSPSPIVLCAAASSRSLPRRAGVVRTARFRPQSCRARPVAMSSAAAAGSSSPSPCPPVDLAEAGEAGGHEERCASKSASDAIFGGIPAGLLPEILSEALVWSSLHGLVVGDRNAPVSGYSLPCWNRWKWGSRLLEVRFDDDPWFVVETVPPRKLTTRIFPFSSCQLLLGFFFLKLLADSCRGIISFPANLGVLACPLFQEKKRRLRLIV